jgi:hypothetical protein
MTLPFLRFLKFARPAGRRGGKPRQDPAELPCNHRRLFCETLEARTMLSAGSAAHSQTLADLPVAAQQVISSAIGQDQET